MSVKPTSPPQIAVHEVVHIVPVGVSFEQLEALQVLSLVAPK
jgi:hypothetical protein